METYELPMYSARMAAKLVGISKDRVRRWVKGYDFRYTLPNRIRKVSQKPVIQRDYEGDSPYITFIELIDLLFVKEFLVRGFSLQKIRNALHEVENNIGHKHFANETFFIDSKSIYLKVKNLPKNSAILELLSDGQWVIEPFIRDLSLKVDFNEVNHIANRWYPLGRKGLIIIDPKISFGRPTIIQRGIATDNIYDLYLGESKNIKNVCEWMNLEVKEVEAAVFFEEKLNAA